MRSTGLRRFWLVVPLGLCSSFVGTIGCYRDSTPAIPDSVDSGAMHSATPSLEPTQLIHEVEKALKRGDWLSAKRDLKAILLQSPENPAALFMMSRVNAQEGNISEAINLLAMIPTREPDFGLAAMGQRADYLSQLNRLDESIRVWQQMLAIDESLDMVRSRLATDLYASGRRIESGWVLQEIADRGVASEDELRRMLNVTDAPKSLDELVRASESDESRQLLSGSPDLVTREFSLTLSRAWGLIHQRRYRDAVIVLQAVNQTAPSTEATTLLALVQADLQQFEAARVTLAGAAANAVRFAPYWIAIGDDWQDRGEDQRAVAAYAKAILLDPTWDLTHERLVGALLRIGRIADARRVDERRFELKLPIEASVAVGDGQPDDERASRFLVNDLERLGQSTQACGWMRHVNVRNPTAFGGRESVEKRIEDLLSQRPETIRKLHLAGIDVSELPDPTPDFGRLEAFKQASLPESNSPLPSVSPPIFADVASKAGLRVTYYNLPERKSKYLRLHEGLGSGVTALDYDRDGWVDFYFGQGSGDPPEVPGTRPNTLVRKVDGEFQDITRLAGCDDRGYATGVTAGDWNQDGWDDVLVGNFGRNRLFLNQGDGTFLDATDKLGLSTATFTASVAFADVDSDSLVDIVEINYVDDSAVFKPMVVNSNGVAENYPGPIQYRSELDVVWHSQGDGTAKKMPLTVTGGNRREGQQVTEADAESVISAPQIGDDANPGLGIVVSNFDSDPGLEIFVANDARPNQLWEVSRVGDSFKLSQSAPIVGLATSSQGRATACMGVATADFDRDGRFDLFVTNWFEEYANFYLQLSPGLFRDSAPKYWLDQYSDHHVGFGAQGVDYDNDGWMDIFVANGHINDYSHLGQPQRMLAQLLINRRDHFEQASLSSGPESYWSLPRIGRCAITADHNRDGRLDIVVTDLVEPAALLENQTITQHHFIQFQLVGTASERTAIGTQIEILDSQPRQTAMTTSGDGYFGRNERLVHFGLGSKVESVSVQVTWPDGSTQPFAGLAVDSRYLLIQGEQQASAL